MSLKYKNIAVEDVRIFVNYASDAELNILVNKIDSALISNNFKSVDINYGTYTDNVLDILLLNLDLHANTDFNKFMCAFDIISAISAAKIGVCLNGDIDGYNLFEVTKHEFLNNINKSDGHNKVSAIWRYNMKSQYVYNSNHIFTNRDAVESCKEQMFLSWETKLIKTVCTQNDGFISFVAYKEDIEKCRRDYGTVVVDGKEYMLTESASVCDDGEQYQASAIDMDLNEFKVYWDTTPAWKNGNEIFALEQQLETARYELKHGECTQEYIDELESKISELEILDTTSIEDESNACDWDCPASVTMTEDNNI